MVRFPALHGRRGGCGGDRVGVDRAAAGSGAETDTRTVAHPTLAIERIARMGHPQFMASQVWATRLCVYSDFMTLFDLLTQTAVADIDPLRKSYELSWLTMEERMHMPSSRKIP
jgi:hypothetical protein